MLRVVGITGAWVGCVSIGLYGTVDMGNSDGTPLISKTLATRLSVRGLGNKYNSSVGAKRIIYIDRWVQHDIVPARLDFESNLTELKCRKLSCMDFTD